MPIKALDPLFRCEKIAVGVVSSGGKAHCTFMSKVSLPVKLPSFHTYHTYFEIYQRLNDWFSFEFDYVFIKVFYGLYNMTIP